VRYSRLVVGLSALLSVPVAAQVAGQFYLEKTVFARGEPVFLYLRISNHSPFVVDSYSRSGEQPMCSSVSIKISSDPPAPTASCSILPDSVCVMNGQSVVSHPLDDGQSTIQRFLLNFQHKIDSPGRYWVDAEKTERADDSLVSIHAKLLFRIDANVPPYPTDKLQAWVNQLKSPDVESRLEGARVLASVAPLSLEATLFAFAHDRDFSRYAPLAFHRLHSERSLVALANMVRTSPAGSTESLQAAQYLAEDGGKDWFSALHEAENRYPTVGYLSYAAEAAGSSIIPELLSLIRDPDRHLEAVEALGWTASRRAIPVLLGQLENTDANTSDSAEQSLRMLTHRIRPAGPRNQDQHARYLLWSRWWQDEGAHAIIFKPNDCGNERPLTNGSETVLVPQP
jgi:hypothetical protein